MCVPVSTGRYTCIHVTHVAVFNIETVLVSGPPTVTPLDHPTSRGYYKGPSLLRTLPRSDTSLLPFNPFAGSDTLRREGESNQDDLSSLFSSSSPPPFFYFLISLSLFFFFLNDISCCSLIRRVFREITRTRCILVVGPNAFLSFTGRFVLEGREER